MAKQETGSESECDQEQLGRNLLINIESDNKWLNSPQQVYLDPISKFPTVADFPIEIQGCKINNLFDTGAQVCHISYNVKTKINIKV